MTASERPGLHARDATPTGEPDPDATTLERARQKDLHAFGHLHRAYVGRVYALCLRMSGNAARAEDLVQEVFLRAWQKIDTFEGKSRFSTWLYRLAVNRVIDLMRAEMRRSLLETREGLVEELEAAHSGIPGMGVDLEAAIGELPPGARAVFVLHDVEGYSHEEIAAMAGIAAGTSKSQLHRARRLLRGMLSR